MPKFREAHRNLLVDAFRPRQCLYLVFRPVTQHRTPGTAPSEGLSYEAIRQTETISPHRRRLPKMYWFCGRLRLRIKPGQRFAINCQRAHFRLHEPFRTSLDRKKGWRLKNTSGREKCTHHQLSSSLLVLNYSHWYV